MCSCSPFPVYVFQFIAVKKNPGTVLNIDVKSLVRATEQNVGVLIRPPINPWQTIKFRLVQL